MPALTKLMLPERVPPKPRLPVWFWLRARVAGVAAVFVTSPAEPGHSKVPVPVRVRMVWALPLRSRVAPGLMTIEVVVGSVLVPPFRTTRPAWIVVQPAPPANCWALKLSVPSRFLCQPVVVLKEVPLTSRVAPAATMKLGIVAPVLSSTPAPRVELPVARIMPEPERFRVLRPANEPTAALVSLSALTWAFDASFTSASWLKRDVVGADSSEPAVV